MERRLVVGELMRAATDSRSSSRRTTKPWRA